MQPYSDALLTGVDGYGLTSWFHYSRACLSSKSESHEIAVLSVVRIQSLKNELSSFFKNLQPGIKLRILKKDNVTT